MFGFRRKPQPAQPVKENIIDRARSRLTEMREYHADRMHYWETKANQAHALMVDHERSFNAYCAALEALDGKSEPLNDDELEKQIDKAVEEFNAIAPAPFVVDDPTKITTVTIDVDDTVAFQKALAEKVANTEPVYIQTTGRAKRKDRDKRPATDTELYGSFKAPLPEGARRATDAEQAE